MAELARNRKAFYDYEILRRLEAGIALSGSEAKSIRAGKINIQGAFVAVRGGEAYLLNASVEPYQPNNTPSEYDATRARKLLLSKAEIAELAEAESAKGLTIVPLSVYSKNKFLKVAIAIARGKRKFDKRQALKKRQTERELKRSL